MQLTTGKKKVKRMFHTKKDFLTCSKLIINELRLCLTRSHNVYFANNEQALLAVFTLGFCYAHAKLIRLKLYNKRSAQAVNNISECVMQNSSNPIKFSHV